MTSVTSDPPSASDTNTAPKLLRVAENEEPQLQPAPQPTPEQLEPALQPASLPESPNLLPLDHPTNARYLYAARAAIMAADAYSHSLFRTRAETVPSMSMGPPPPPTQTLHTQTQPEDQEVSWTLPLCPDTAGRCESGPRPGDADASVLPPHHV
ncbi:unnamed protein product [Cutaneotrichosporon oleaginosum]